MKNFLFDEILTDLACSTTEELYMIAGRIKEIKLKRDLLLNYGEFSQNTIEIQDIADSIKYNKQKIYAEIEREKMRLPKSGK
ncbi:hypothetical protein [Bacillus atrophaeus]|uniref:hypothetical protein n=1 Tax=Bacillus atrophaeus TaxID=1452 RepID=UPI00228298B0|nr:hypothetical protein [Bacillus atrophaeus]MCY8915047.1 hypothetical protein [Bacillus atrophaeus]MEC0927862.1 hypothetical protein [Bacillus atrophaeus]